jgi:DNA replication protein DnaC
VRFFRTTELVTTLIEARDERSFLRLKTQLAKLDLLVLDELGYVPASKVGPSCCSMSSPPRMSGPA